MPRGADQGREGVHRPGRGRQGTSVPPGAGPCSSGDTLSEVFELLCRTKPPTNDSQRGGPPAPVLGPLNTSSGEECKLASTLVLLWGCIFYSPNCKPTPSSSLPKGDPVFRAAACCDPLCLAKQFKLFSSSFSQYSISTVDGG